MLRNHYSTFTLLSALITALPAVPADDVLYFKIIETGETEGYPESGTNWHITHLDFTNYNISPSGHIGYGGEMDDLYTSGPVDNRRAIWFKEITNSGITPTYASSQRMLVSKVEAPLVTDSDGDPVFFPGYSQGRYMHVGETEVGSVPREPIVFAPGKVSVNYTYDPLYSWSNNLAMGLEYIAQKTEVPGSGTVLPDDTLFYSAGIDRINRLGSTAVGEYTLVGPGISISNNNAIITFASGETPRLIAYKSQSVPGFSGFIFTQIGNDLYNNNHRDVVFVSTTEDTSVTKQVICYHDDSASTLSVVAMSGEAADDWNGGTYDGQFELWGMNNSGYYVFTNYVDHSTDSGRGIWADQGSGIELIFRDDDEAPGFNDPSVTLEQIWGVNDEGNLDLSESGWFLFGAYLGGTGIIYDGVLYLGNLDGDAIPIVRDGDPVIGLEGATLGPGFINNVKGPNEDGRIVFTANYMISGVSGYKTGVFLTDAEYRPHLVATEDEDFPLMSAGTGNVIKYRQSITALRQIDDTGRLLYIAQESGTENSVLFLAYAHLFGDIDQNGTRNAADIDALAAAINASSTDDKWDMNGDGSVTFADFLYWVDPIAMTVQGDVDLDGDVDDADVGTVTGNFTGPVGAAGGKGWATGDTDGDGDVDDADIAKVSTNFTGPL